MILDNFIVTGFAMQIKKKKEEMSLWLWKNANIFPFRI